eukprot:3487965-Lingulodinium_polyedra.AAC.1
MDLTSFQSQRKTNVAMCMEVGIGRSAMFSRAQTNVTYIWGHNVCAFCGNHVVGNANIAPARGIWD